MPHQSAMTSTPMQLPHVCAWCADPDDLADGTVSHGICQDCRRKHFGDVTPAPSENKRRHDALRRVAEAMRDYLAITPARDLPAFSAMSHTQQARLIAGALVGLESINPRRIQEGR